MSDKKTEKLLKRPDAFQSSVMKGINWFRAERQRVVFVAVPVVLILILGAGFQYYRLNQSEARKNKLGEISKVFAKEEKDLAKKKAQIREDLRKLEASSKDPKAAEAAGSNTAAIAAKKLELQALTEDHQGSLAKYEQFFQANVRNSEGWRAGMAAVGILIKDKKLESASVILKSILDNAMGIDFYQVQARLMYVAILEDLKKFDEAIAQLNIAQPLAAEDLQPRILLTKARLEIQVGKKDEAQKTLDALIADHASSPEARQAIGIKAL